LIAAGALLVGVALAVVVAVMALGSGGGDGGGGDSAHLTSTPSAHGPTPAPIKLPAVAEVRNATPQPGWESFSGPVPILRYDAVGTPEPGATYPELFVPSEDFGEQLDWLEENGYEAVGLEAVQAAWAGKGTLPPKPVVLSFDGVDGELLSTVVPELSRRGWPGVLVLDAEAPPPQTAAVARLIALGWDLEPSGQDPGAARRFVKAHYSAAARIFAAPPAGSSAPETAAVKEAGFDGATVTIGGGFAEAAHPFDLPRITIFGLSKIDGFVEALRSGGQGVGA
jgi:hypothetical protein